MKALKGKLPTVRVGILGNSNARADGESNAQIGSWHEFGTSKLPVRSFLRLPISALLDKYLAKEGALEKKTLKEVLESGTIAPWLQKIGFVAETIVSDAFASGGFGIWPPSDMKNKTNHQTLVESQQLRNSITSEVKA